MGRELYRIKIGSGEKKAVLTGGHCGEIAECDALLSFAEEYVSAIKESRRMCESAPKYVSVCRSIVIYPLLNPDALAYRSEGVNDDNPIKDRLLRMNGNSADFSEWRANGRGVSLERNVRLGFERRKAVENANGILDGHPRLFSGYTPESEPELRSFLDDMRKSENVKVMVNISKGKNRVYAGDRCESLSGGERLLKSIQRISGMKREREDQSAGIVDVVSCECNVPSYKLSSEKCSIRRLRDLLCSLPMLV